MPAPNEIKGTSVFHEREYGYSEAMPFDKKVESKSNVQKYCRQFKITKKKINLFHARKKRLLGTPQAQP